MLKLDIFVPICLDFVIIRPQWENISHYFRVIFLLRINPSTLNLLWEVEHVDFFRWFFYTSFAVS